MSDRTQHVRSARLEIAFEERGDAHGIPVIMAHGYPDHVRTGDAVAVALAKAVFRTLAPYQRGYGATKFLTPHIPRSGQVTVLAGNARRRV